MFKTLKDAQSWIEGVAKFGPKYDLSRMEKASKLLNAPEKKYPTVHIAGTNGKGSTVAFTSHILMAAGYKTGMYISPYIEAFNERFMINHQPISDDLLLNYINQFYAFNQTFFDHHQETLSFFELTTLIAFEYFKDENVDIAVIEVGLGGRLDATNIITPLVSVITSIGYDHMQILGNTLEEISKEKLGIVKEGVPLVSGVLDETLIPIFKEMALKKSSKIYFVSPLEFTPSIPQVFRENGIDYAIHLLGAHQIQNAKCAIKATELLNDHGFNITQEYIKIGLREAYLPGRFEKIGPVVLDGAHNVNGMESLVKTLNTYFKDQNYRVIFGVMGDKETLKMQTMIESIAEEIIFTDVNTERALSKEVLYERSLHPNKKVMDLETLPFDKPTIVCGSLYLVSALRKKLITEFNH